MPEERINRSCRWTDDVAVLAPPGDRARRAHLIEDVRVAQDLGIRYGDSLGGRLWNDANRDARTRCTEASLRQIMQRHGVARAEIEAVTGAREPWIDLLAIWMPVTLLFLAASHRAARHVVAGYEPEDRWVAALVLAAIMPLAAGFALGAAQIWGGTVDSLRLRNEHISYRMFYLPIGRHAWLLWGVAMALFAAVAARVLWRGAGGGWPLPTSAGSRSSAR